MTVNEFFESGYGKGNEQNRARVASKKYSVEGFVISDNKTMKKARPVLDAYGIRQILNVSLHFDYSGMYQAFLMKDGSAILANRSQMLEILGKINSAN